MNDCIEHHQNTNYGIARWRGGRISLHRKAWIEANGEIPDGLYVCHKCNNKRCINPEHLYLGTQSKNMQDAYRDGLIPLPLGEEHHWSKLTDSDVVAIREDTRFHSVIAKEYGVAQSTVTRIKNNKIWRHV